MSIAVCIYGPTAVGKSKFAEMLATRISGEIINCDAAQFYKPLTIGTAKPDWHDAAVPHHMFDICQKPEQYSVAAYRRDAENLIAAITARGKVPIFVGGSGFYMHSLFFPVHAPSAVATPSHADTPVSWETLQEIDPVRAATIHPHDTYRIARALSLYQQTNQLPSALKPDYCPIIPTLFIELVCDPALLHQNIRTRIIEMLESGWLAEVESLLDTPWEAFVLQKKWIGYPELIAYCHAGKDSAQLPVVIDAIVRSTWRYARKQMAYARMLVQKIQSHGAQSIKIDLTSNALELYLKQLAEQIGQLQKGCSNDT